MNKVLGSACAVAVVVLSACAHHSVYENEAEKITRAVQANNLALVSSDFNQNVYQHINRIQVAEYSAQLAPLGNIKSVTEQPCADGSSYHCMSITFDKGSLDEQIGLDDQQKVTHWHFTNLKTTP